MTGRERAVVTAVGVDQPGIVAALTGALMELGCNLEDSSMSMLQGNFAVLLVIALPAGVDAKAAEAALGSAADPLGLLVTVRPLPTGPRSTEVPATGAGYGQVFAFSVHGADRPGIVHRATQALAAVGGNIVDLATRLVGTDAEPTYVLTITVGFAPDVDGDSAMAATCRSVEDFGVQCFAHAVDVDVF
jgi:glycine cleavage system transcriptional repressor